MLFKKICAVVLWIVLAVIQIAWFADFFTLISAGFTILQYLFELGLILSFLLLLDYSMIIWSIDQRSYDKMMMNSRSGKSR